MTLNVSVDEGNTWTKYTPELIDFEQYPTTLLRFVETDNAEYTCQQSEEQQLAYLT